MLFVVLVWLSTFQKYAWDDHIPFRGARKAEKQKTFWKAKAKAKQIKAGVLRDAQMIT